MPRYLSSDGAKLASASGFAMARAVLKSTVKDVTLLGGGGPSGTPSRAKYFFTMSVSWKTCTPALTVWPVEGSV